MSDIFISYSNKDKTFAIRLVDDLERFYNVWIDKEELSGGLEWERMIEKALQDCHVFLVIVSPNSNDSEWVARETIRAENLKKYRIPIILSGDLPLRLLNLHYIDFRGDFEGGFRDLLEVLQEQIEPEDREKDEVNRLLGAGLRAQVANDYSKANNLIGQALVLEPAIAESVEALWKSLRTEAESNWATEFMAQIEIQERAKLLKSDVESKQAGDKVDVYRWRLKIVASPEILDKIDYVRYQLHETFPRPIQIIRSREKSFPIVGQAWGIFPVPIEIHFKDGTVAKGIHDLYFENRTVPLQGESSF